MLFYKSKIFFFRDGPRPVRPRQHVVIPRYFLGHRITQRPTIASARHLIPSPRSGAWATTIRGVRFHIVSELSCLSVASGAFSRGAAHTPL